MESQNAVRVGGDWPSGANFVNNRPPRTERMMCPNPNLDYCIMYSVTFVRKCSASVFWAPFQE